MKLSVIKYKFYQTNIIRLIFDWYFIIKFVLENKQNKKENKRKIL